ncbi:MAG: type I-U CRISPR-associated helicase/endonuclease Cas3 [Myxococcales bacterium]|nr:MAG: type I-U CRISPR-associated helicase/endonuclease Cas3 [Myxococcales bacterium]
MQLADNFKPFFKLLTDHEPFLWQEELFDKFLQRKLPSSCDIPTGLGKTSAIAIWLLALASHASTGIVGDFPRRLVYVVNRRTVVDQATREAEQMRKALDDKPDLHEVAESLRSLGAWSSDAPLAISTLRGQFADNAEWRVDPARPAVIVGTVDMIGSRLLFAAYGRGFKSRPLHAGFLGQDTLLIHDEAHLEPAFQKILAAIESEQQRCREFRRFRTMALTATSRSEDQSCGLTVAERTPKANPSTDDPPPLREVWKRVTARKGISFFPVDNEKKIAAEVAERALEHRASKQAILVFLRKLEDVKTVKDRLGKEKLGKEKLAVQLLTGTLRGLERDNLAKENPVFARFMPKPEVKPQEGTVYLVCTSAGEVGVNISADHLICDLTPFDSMTQRFGRVNRFGDGDALIDVVHASGKDGAESETKGASAFNAACEKTLALLKRLPKRPDGRHDASTAASNGLPLADRLDAYTPSPVILPASDILFDAWALTSIYKKLPGRPPVTDWLHGIADEWEPPETHVAWREEVGLLNGDLIEAYEPSDLLESYPLKPHELLRDRTKRVFEQLEKIAERSPDLSVWFISSEGLVDPVSLADLVERGEKALAHSTVLLPPHAGGLKEGMLSGEAEFKEGEDYDVADRWNDEAGSPRRRRVWDDDLAPQGMRLTQIINLRLDEEGEIGEEEEDKGRRWRWYVKPRSADDEGSRTACFEQTLDSHGQTAEHFASKLVAKLGLGEPVGPAVTFAARWHDLGKRREVWQKSIGNRRYPELVLAKSGGKMRPLDLHSYRHELGSLIDISNLPDFLRLSPEAQDLALHLIAAHHGRARPHFPENESFDRENSEDDSARIARETPRRFARLQRKYGRWGLAYLESLVRATDAMASQSGDDSAIPAQEVEK